jgi:prepilin-type N-terminal cleavage/methylation domain-containing protein
MMAQKRNQGPAPLAGGGRGRRPGPRGMTLIELLVSTAILALMILLVNSLLVSSRRTIEIAQTTIRANANVRALVDIIRKDIAGMDPDGFLAIVVTDKGEYQTGQYHLIFTTAGTYHSLCANTTQDLWANAARVDIGLPAKPHKVDDKGTPTDNTDDIEYRILYRRAILHNPTDPQPFVDGEDHHQLAVPYYQFAPDKPVEELAPWLYANTYYPYYRFALHPHGESDFPRMISPDSPQPEMKLPALHLNDLRTLWPYVVSEVSDFRVQWTDGRTDAKTGRLLWFDKDNPWVPIQPGNDPLWQSLGAAQLSSFPQLVEFNLMGPRGQPPVYCAFWSYRNKNNWPKALRLMFKVGIPARSYEVVVDLPY